MVFVENVLQSVQHFLLMIWLLPLGQVWSSKFCVAWGSVLFWPLLHLLLLNYVLALGHRPALKDFIWSSDANVLRAMQWGTGKHWTLCHPELFFRETKEEISPRFSNREQLCFYWKSDLIFYYGPCDSEHGSCVGH